MSCNKMRPCEFAGCINVARYLTTVDDEQFLYCESHHVYVLRKLGHPVMASKEDVVMVEKPMKELKLEEPFPNLGKEHVAIQPKPYEMKMTANYLIEKIKDLRKKEAEANKSWNDYCDQLNKAVKDYMKLSE